MEVFKFGGASVSTPQNIQKVIQIIKAYQQANNNQKNNPEINNSSTSNLSTSHSSTSNALLLVVSAMGKTTNALENILANFWLKNDVETPKKQLLDYHKHILDFFLPKEKSEEVFNQITQELDTILAKLPQIAYNRDKAYDSLVGFGEIMSSKIMAQILQNAQIPITWIDARLMIKTDETWREGHIDWEITHTNIKELKSILHQKMVITQGFIGSTHKEDMITLGREGSDYSASVFASALQAQKLTIWKDVAGVLSADPNKYLNIAQLWDNLTYTQAVTMTYYGASVIHPKTIAPLKQADIELWVKSYINPQNQGTCISHHPQTRNIPSLMTKSNQILLRFESPNFQFLSEEEMSDFLLKCKHCNISVGYFYKNAFQLYIITDHREEKLARLQQLQKYEIITTGEFWTMMYADEGMILQAKEKFLPKNVIPILETKTESREGTLHHFFVEI